MDTEVQQAGSRNTVVVRVSDELFDSGEEINGLHAQNSGLGAVASFTGYCRDEGGRLKALELEHYPGMTETALQDIAHWALKTFDIDGVRLVHRFGLIKPAEPIVFVGAASAHRKAALEAVDAMMDYLKTDAPFWKKEHPATGEPGAWVEAKDSDAKARARLKP